MVKNCIEFYIFVFLPVNKMPPFRRATNSQGASYAYRLYDRQNKLVIWFSKDLDEIVLLKEHGFRGKRYQVQGEFLVSAKCTYCYKLSHVTGYPPQCGNCLDMWPLQWAHLKHPRVGFSYVYDYLLPYRRGKLLTGPTHLLPLICPDQDDGATEINELVRQSRKYV